MDSRCMRKVATGATVGGSLGGAIGENFLLRLKSSTRPYGLQPYHEECGSFRSLS